MQTPCQVYLGGMRKVLVTGAGGQLGRRLMAVASAAGVEAIGMDRAGLDITDGRAVAAALKAICPDAIINAAGYTAVDRAEQEAALAHEVNVEGPRNLAAACASQGIDFLHVSTDYVFDGSKRSPYVSADAAAPLGVYGQTKWQGEQAVLATADRSWVLRVAWLYDSEGPNFLHTMLRLGQQGRALKVVDDQIGTPTSAHFLAEALLAWAEDPSRWAPGIWHFGHCGSTSWYGFAQAIFKHAGLEVDLAPCPTEAYPTPAKRPKYSHLDPEAWHEAWGKPPVHWRDALAHCMQHVA